MAQETPYNENLTLPLSDEKIQWTHRVLGHPGISSLTPTLTELFRSQVAKRQVAEAIRPCPECQFNKHSNQNYGILTGQIVSLEPWIHIALDIYGPIDWKKNGQKGYILSIIDQCTRWCEFKTLKSISASKISEAFQNAWLSRYPLPQKVTTDNGRQFVSNQFKNLLEQYNIKQHTIIPYNPTSNSIIERIHGTLGDLLRIYRNKSLENATQLAGNRLRTAFHHNLQTSPMSLALGCNKLDPTIRYQVKGLLQRAKISQETRRKYTQERENKRRTHHSYFHTKCLLKERNPAKGEPLWKDPYLVISEDPKTGSLTVKEEGTGSHRKVSIRHVKPFKEGHHIVSTIALS